MPKFTPASHAKAKGQSLSELALVFTLLIIILTGVIDLGSLFYTYTSLQDTTQEGAIYAATNPTDGINITNHVLQSAKAPLDVSSVVSVDEKCNGQLCKLDSNSCPGQGITVNVKYTYNLMMPLIPAIVGRSSIDLTASVTATILQADKTVEAMKGTSTPCN